MTCRKDENLFFECITCLCRESFLTLQNNCESLTKRWTQKTALGREQKSVKTLTRILLNSSQLEIENRKPMLRYYVGMGNKNNV